MSKAFQTIVFIAGFAVMLAGLPGIALAGRVMIDDFSGKEQQVRDPEAFGILKSSTVEASGAIDGWRKMEANLDSGSAGSVTGHVFGDQLSIELGAEGAVGSSGSVIVTYAGAPDGNGGFTGLGEDGNGLSLFVPGFNSIGNHFFAVDIAVIDQAPLPDGQEIIATVGLTSKVGENSFNDATFSVPISTAGTIKLPFSSFAGFTATDFERITRITLEMQGFEGVDFTLDSFSTSVPEPSTIVLFGLGVAALYGTSRWRKRKTKSNV